MSFLKPHVYLLSSLLVLASCQKSNLNDLQEAQSCLNRASAAEARGCVSKISGDNSPQANSLKCAAIFISEGYGDAASFVNAIESINNNSGSCTGGCSSTINALNALNFKSADPTDPTGRATNNATATEAFNVCSLSGVKFYTQISSLFKIGTEVSMLVYKNGGPGGATPSEDEIKAQIGNMDSVQLGTVVTTTYNTACQDIEKASDATKKYCAELKSAVENPNATPQGIGDCLKEKLKDPDYICT
ncbi:hypothetical protein [Pseudobdellovibrio exovorus]|uniref:Lipoprotein n=1 Tax=Pseudobdellovibrio exovorus JSS TaxID=1184267 RepID=M4V840_9BACT|nr:hypothetical protein [Pseudobdellovibrio exovorus]AGH94610.1 hypothetical protein A11Q_390 [Pseudobdellovibrio exovorus JSS]